MPGLAIALVVMMITASLIGYGSRKWANQLATDRGVEPNLAQESYLIGSMLGLLALLLAFSLSIAINRFDERRQLVIQEANAIGTAYLRAQLLDEPHRSRLSNLLIDYTDNRIKLAAAQPGKVGKLLKRNDRLLTDIWASVTAARESALTHGLSTPILLAFNEVIDLDSERKMSRRMGVPPTVLMLVMGFLAITAAVLGYVLEERRSRLGALFLFVLLSLYVSIIADLNRPTSGSIRESQEPMELIRASLKAQPLAAFDRYRAAVSEDSRR